MTESHDTEQEKTRSDEITRREFFKAAGRGAVAVGGLVVLAGGGLTMLSAGCGDDDPVRPVQYY